jgi:DNA-binding IclR family transcriptional regulator
VQDWSFLTNHARVLLCIAHDPGVRLRDIAGALGVSERSAYSIVTVLTEAGYVVKVKHGRRNRYQIQARLPLRESTSRDRTIGEVLDLLVDADADSPGAEVDHDDLVEAALEGARRSRC